MKKEEAIKIIEKIPQELWDLTRSNSITLTVEGLEEESRRIKEEISKLDAEQRELLVKINLMIGLLNDLRLSDLLNDI